MVNSEFAEEMTNDVINMSHAWDKEKNPSLTGIEPMTFRTQAGCFNHCAICMQ